MTYECINTKYDNTGDTYNTVQDFIDMVKDVFGVDLDVIERGNMVCTREDNEDRWEDTLIIR